jgi:hypothetical protein
LHCLSYSLCSLLLLYAVCLAYSIILGYSFYVVYAISFSGSLYFIFLYLHCLSCCALYFMLLFCYLILSSCCYSIFYAALLFYALIYHRFNVFQFLFMFSKFCGLSANLVPAAHFWPTIFWSSGIRHYNFPADCPSRKRTVPVIICSCAPKLCKIPVRSLQKHASVPAGSNVVRVE